MCGVFAPQYFGSVYYYAQMQNCRRAVIDSDLRFNKRFKSVHRCDIADTRGPLKLTVPVSSPSDNSMAHTPLQWRDMSVSAHGQWWHVHRVSLESAYGRTPYFEFYIDRFLPWLAHHDMSVVDFDLELDAIVRRTLSMDVPVSYSISDIDPDDFTDFRRNEFPNIKDVPYYQVRALKFGFIPGLSILDLIFNMGPEAPLVLREMAKSLIT